MAVVVAWQGEQASRHWIYTLEMEKWYILGYVYFAAIF